MVQATSTLYRAPKLLVAGEVGTVKLHAPMTALDKITLGGPRSYPDVPSAGPRPVAFRQQREDDQQQIGPTRVRQSASKRLSQAGVLVPVVLHDLMARRTAVGDQAICRAAECAGVTFGPSPEAAFTKPWLSPRVEHWRQFGRLARI